MFSLTSRMLDRGDQPDRGGGWGLPGLDLLQASLRGETTTGSASGTIRKGQTGGAGQKGLLFGYFRQGSSGDGNDSSSGGSSSRSNGRGGSSSKKGKSSRSSMAGAGAAAAGGAAAEWLTKEDNYVEVVLEDRVHLEFQTVLGRLVLKSIEEGREALLTGVPLGAALCSVDGELLQVDNFARLMATVEMWTDVEGGSVGPPLSVSPPIAAGGGGSVLVGGGGGEGGNGDENGKEQQEQQAVADNDDNDAPVRPPRLHLTFRLPSNTPASIDYQDLFPLPRVESTRPLAPAETEEELRHKKLVAGFRSRLATAEEEEKDEEERVEGSSRPAVAAAASAEPTDQVIQHFLALGEWDVEKGLVEFVAVREEARELLLAARTPASRGGDNGRVVLGAGEEGGQEGSSLPSRLVWDPAVEEPSGLEEFPLFEAEAGEEGMSSSSKGEGEGGGGEGEGEEEAAGPLAAEYEVVITEQETKLGITVENVLERTIICNVARASPAFRAGMEEGCLVVALGESSTRAMCHKEVIDRLTQMHRPLRMTLRRLPPERLQQRRAEMVALVHAHGTPGPESTSGGVSGWDASVESRSQVIEWAEEKMLSLLRLLVVGSLLHLPSSSAAAAAAPVSESSSHSSSPSFVPPMPMRRQGLPPLSIDEQDREESSAGPPLPLPTSFGFGSAAVAPTMDDDRLGLWQGRLLDIASSLQSELQQAHAFTHRARQRVTGLGLIERLRALGGHLEGLLELCREVWWEHQPVVAALRWYVIDLVVQLLCVDVDGCLSVSQDSRELVEGPAITLLQELVVRLPRTQVESNVTMLLYRLAGSSSSHARVACAALAPCVYDRLPPAQQLQVRGLLMRLLGEDSALIRSVVVEALADLTGMMDCHSVKWLYLMLEASAKDGSPRQRTKLLQICYSLAQVLHRAAATYAHRPTVLQEVHLNRCKLLPFVNCAAEDPDWQVRAAFAYFCPGFVDCFGTRWDDVFLDNLETLMRDEELAARKLAVDSIPKIAEAWLARGSAAGGAGSGGEQKQQLDQDASRAVVKQRVLEHLLPGFIRLVSDSSVQVRASVAAATGRLLHLLTATGTEAQPAAAAGAVTAKEGEVDGALVELMTPLMQRILHDEAPAQVALALLQGMRMDDAVLYYGVGSSNDDNDDDDDHKDKSARTSTIKGNIPLPLVESQVDLLLPAVIFLASHSSWRLRQAVVEALPPFQLLIGPGHKYAASLQELWQELLLDGVEIVRRAAAAHFILIGKVLARYPEHGGGESRRWLEERVVPCVQDCLESPAFKQRQLGLHMCEILLREGCLVLCEDSAGLIERELWPLMLARFDDPLANVRLVAASVLEHSFKGLPKQLWGSREAPLCVMIERLCREDADGDVRYFGRRVAGKLGLDVVLGGGVGWWGLVALEGGGGGGGWGGW